ncbi:YqgQ family protein [Evansella sp. AB-rgal1]|uniref:YqgQ family protein n=1 Tax=Evansella sp. AB-rgal1 TaxID=3242696 RepID=UPI00359DEC85
MNLYELQQLFKKFGTFIYTGQKLGDIEIMEDELKELYRMGLIEDKIYRDGILLLIQERRKAENDEK